MNRSRRKRQDVIGPRRRCGRTPSTRGQGSQRRAPRGEVRAGVSWYGSKRPILRFVCFFVLFLGLFYLAYVPIVKTGVYQAYLGLNAEATGAVLRILGHGASVNGASVASPRFGFNIVSGCDAMEMLAIFAGAVLASPVLIRVKISFVLLGSVVLLTVNLVRLVTLFLIGVYFPAAVDAMHWDVWPGLLILAVLLCWWAWARWAMRYRGSARHVAT